MKLHYWSDDAADSNRVVLLFGLGLIGGAIDRALRALAHPTVEETLAFSWAEDNGVKSQQLRAVEQRISALTSGQDCILDLVWAAGKAGFGADSQQLQGEHDNFELVLDWLVRMPGRLQCRAHVFSSAGGLFEGQARVALDSKPAPKRSYGRAKLRMEALVDTLPADFGVAVYRPSTAYGLGRDGARVGLISALVQSVYRNKTVRIYASPNTLRDYVFTEDIGHFVVDKVLDSNLSRRLYLLASGKPTSVRELIELIERILDRHLYLQYEAERNNSLSNTYVREVLPEGWLPTDLRAGVAQTAMRMRYLAS